MSGAVKAIAYDAVALQFVDGDAPIDDALVREIWGSVVERGAAKARTVMTGLVENGLTEAEAALALRRLVRALHMGGAAVGLGGVARVESADLARLGPVLRDEYRHLLRRLSSFTAYREYLAGGGDPTTYKGARVTPAQLVATVGGYANRARGTMENARLWAAKRAGHTEVRRILRPGENCHAVGTGKKRTPGCVEEHKRGWHSIDTFVPIGKCACGSACNCGVETRRPQAAEGT